MIFGAGSLHLGGSYNYSSNFFLGKFLLGLSIGTNFGFSYTFLGFEILFTFSGFLYFFYTGF